MGSRGCASTPRRVALSVALAAAAGAAPARAAIYENVVDVDDEDDLFTLSQRGDISAETLATLLELLREGVDLNIASRDHLYELPGLTYADVDAVLEYRRAQGHIADPAVLVGAGALSAEQLLQIAPFLLRSGAPVRLPVSGRVRAVSQVASADDVAPPFLVSARAKAPWGLSAGIMVASTRRQVGTPGYDATSNGLSTPGFGYQLHVPRFYAQWDAGNRRVVVGTFTIGFGERLTLDTTTHVTPRGISLTEDFQRASELTGACRVASTMEGVPPPDADCSGEASRYLTADYQLRDVFRGLAGSITDVPLGPGVAMSAHGFASLQSRSLYQYELYDRRTCDDPRDDERPGCAAPPVVVGDGAGGLRVVSTTLPHLFNELAGGGHADLTLGGRGRVGLTGWGAVPLFGAAPMQLDFQESSRYPNGGAFGAVGVDGQAGWGALNLFGELSRSFNRSVGGGGGLGAVGRATWSRHHQELELSVRYYDARFTAPYARPISGPDEVDGQRATDELGVRGRYAGRLAQEWELRALADVWTLPSSSRSLGPAGMVNLHALVRAGFTGWDVFRPAVWLETRNRNLASNQRGVCDPVVYVEGDPGFACSNDLYRVAARVELRPTRRPLAFIVQGSTSLRDDVRYRDRFAQDVLLWGEARFTPLDWLQLRLKSRYVFQDISDNTYLEQSLWTFVEAAAVPARGTRLALRYDVVAWLDQRDSTRTRVPNPEHRVLVDLRTEF